MKTRHVDIQIICASMVRLTFLGFLLAACSSPDQLARLDSPFLETPIAHTSPIATEAPSATATLEPTPKPSNTPESGKAGEPVRISLGQTVKPGEIAETARQHLAGLLKAPIEKIAVSRTDAAEWPDATLGCGTKAISRPERQSSQSVPGYRYLLISDGKIYEYRSGGGWLIFCKDAKPIFTEGISLPTGKVENP